MQEIDYLGCTIKEPQLNHYFALIPLTRIYADLDDVTNIK